MAFARRHWYVVASADEIGTTPLARTVCGDDLVLWRRGDGSPAALADRCAHRRFPLSLGTVVDDVLVCGYHGFTYDCTGSCVAVPGQTRIPSRADVRRYPLAEVGPWVFVWMGDPDAPDTSRLPDAPWLTDPAWAVVKGMQPLAARYELPFLDELRELDVLYDRSESGELLHFYSALEGRVFFEVLERRGTYDGYGAANSPVRMAAQRTTTRRRHAAHAGRRS